MYGLDLLPGSHEDMNYNSREPSALFFLIVYAESKHEPRFPIMLCESDYSQRMIQVLSFILNGWLKLDGSVLF